MISDIQPDVHGPSKWSGVAAYGSGNRRFSGCAAVATRRAKLTAYLRILANTAVWYQPGIGVTGTLNASDWANWTGPGSVGASGDLAQALGANQPIYLPWTGANYAYLPAVASNTLTSPNQTVTGSKTITFDVALNDYTPEADVTLFDKTSGNDGFAVKWLTTDKIRLVIGDGVGLTNVDVVAASGFADGSRHTATIAWADGVGATFSYDGVQSGSQVAAVKTLTNAAVALTIGSTTSIGKVYRVQVGSLYDMNASLSGELITNGATFTGGAAETWTLNNTGATPAQIVASPNLLFNGVAHYLSVTFSSIPQPISGYFVLRKPSYDGKEMTDGPGAGLNRFALFTGPDGSINIHAGVSLANANFPTGPYAVVSAQTNGASSQLTVNNGTTATGDAGTQDILGFRLGANYSAANFGNVQFKEIILRSAADSAATRLAIVQRLAALHGITL